MSAAALKIAKFKESLKRPRDCSCEEKNSEAAGVGEGHLTTEVRKTEPQALNQVTQKKEGLQKEAEVSKRQRKGRTGKCYVLTPSVSKIDVLRAVAHKKRNSEDEKWHRDKALCRFDCSNRADLAGW